MSFLRIARSAMLLACLVGATCHARYANETSCAELADTRLPELSEELVGEDAVAEFTRELEALNPDLARKAELIPGWNYRVLAECYGEGVVVEQNRAIWMTLLRVSALRGNDSAAHVLASLDVFRSDDPERQRRGFEYLENEHLQSDSAFAAGKLGWAYQKGLGVDQDIGKAVELYRHAAGRGMTYWQYLLAHAYERGYLGLPVDQEQAAYWREFKPKVHVALYECWVALYYADGTFPENEALRAEYEKICEETDLADTWER